jgi:hypothetical protein
MKVVAFRLNGCGDRQGDVAASRELLAGKGSGTLALGTGAERESTQGLAWPAPAVPAIPRCCSVEADPPKSSKLQWDCSICFSVFASCKCGEEEGGTLVAYICKSIRSPFYSAAVLDISISKVHE